VRKDPFCENNLFSPKKFHDFFFLQEEKKANLKKLPKSI